MATRGAKRCLSSSRPTHANNVPKQEKKAKLHQVVKMLKQHEKKLKKLKKKMATKLKKVQAKKEEQIAEADLKSE